MRRLRWLAIFLLVALVVIAVQMRSVPHAQALVSGDADIALSAYTNALYDAHAKYFYADTTRSSYNDFWKEAVSWNIIMDAYARTTSNTSRQMIDDVYDGFMARNTDMATACNTSNSFTLNDILRTITARSLAQRMPSIRRPAIPAISRRRRPSRTNRWSM